MTEVSAENVVTKDAYMLFYQRRCERNAAAAARLRSYVSALSGDTSLTSLANSSVDNTLCGTQLPFTGSNDCTENVGQEKYGICGA